MHRFLMDCPEDKVVDHRNREKNDNRKEPRFNLMKCGSQSVEKVQQRLGSFVYMR